MESSGHISWNAGSFGGTQEERIAMKKFEGKTNVLYMSKYRRPAVVRRISEQELAQAKVFMELLLSTGVDMQDAYETLIDVMVKEKLSD